MKKFSEIAQAKTFVSLLPLLLSAPLEAQFTYQGSGNWGTAANWSNASNNGEVPGANLDEQSLINGGSNVTLNSSQPSVRALRLEGGSGTATLNVLDGASIDFTTATNWDSSIGRSGANGIVNQSGGEIDFNFLELGRDNGTSGEYFLTGGNLLISRGAKGNNATNGASLVMGTNDSSAAGGTATSLIEISGGSFRTRAGVWMGGTNGNADATFRVLGSRISQIGIGSHNTLDGNWLMNPGTTLSVGIDLGGVTPIFIDDQGAGNNFATFESGSLLEVDYYDGLTSGGGTWTVLELENGDITDNGLSFAPGVDTSIWSFSVDNSGANGRLTVTAIGDPLPPFGHDLTIGSTPQQKMRYGMDYERLWYWTGGLNNSERDQVARWSAVETDIDFIRVAINSKYELVEGTYDLSAYTSKIIPMMQEMQQANPNIKFFASPRPLNEAVSGVAWQPYPQWVTGSTGNSSNFNFDWEKCAQYLERYILLMKSYGFKISFLDLTNEWQDSTPFGGGKINTGEARDITNYLKANLDAADMPQIISSSAWNYSQGSSWINAHTTTARRNSIDIAASHNTDRSGDAQTFADTVHDVLGPDTEIWNTEVHGWKSTSSENETTSFYYYLEAIRAGFGGINGWLAIGTTNQGHSYILNPSGTPRRNVKYHIFKKLSETSNYGHALNILDEPVDLLINSSTDADGIPRNISAFIKGNLMTVWVINENTTPVPLKITPAGHTIGESTVRRTRWTDPADVAGFETYETVSSSTSFNSTIPGESVCCFEIVLGTEDFATAQIEAEDYSHQWGTSLETGNDGTPTGQNMANISDGDFSRYGAVALAENSNVSFRVARPNGRPNGSILVREGSSEGPILGQVDIPVTGNWQRYQTVETELTNDEGIYNLYLEFAEDGTTGNAFTNFNWFTVNEVNLLPVTGLAATPASSSQIDLTWNATSGAESYNLKRATTNAGPFTTVASDLSGTSHRDTGLAPGQQYYYVISAVEAGNEGPDSAAVSATTAIAAPTNLVATTDGENAISLTWNASPTATAYRIQRSTTSGGPYTPIAVSGVTSYRNPGLTAGTVYYYVVEAINSSGLSLPSAEASAMPIAPTDPITPENLIVSGVTATNLDQPVGTLSFTIAQSGNGHTYQAQWSDTLDDGSWTDFGAPLTGTGDALDFDIAFPTALSKRFYRVKVSLP